MCLGEKKGKLTYQLLSLKWCNCNNSFTKKCHFLLVASINSLAFPYIPKCYKIVCYLQNLQMAARNIFSICKNPYFLNLYLYVLDIKCVEQDTDFLHWKQDRYGKLYFVRIFNET